MFLPVVGNQAWSKHFTGQKHTACKDSRTNSRFNVILNSIVKVYALDHEGKFQLPCRYTKESREVLQPGEHGGDQK